MTHQRQRVNRNRDPFTTKPLPRSFYHPTPKKYVKNLEQAIEAPQHLEGDPILENNVEEKRQIFLRDESSVVPVLTEVEAKPDETDCIFDETWPSSARLSSARDTSHYTVSTDLNASGEYNLSAAVGGLEVYDSNKYGAMKNTDNHKRGGEASSSTLQKYIERFRNSEPKPRELRMKERQVDHQEFWWLKPEHGSKLIPRSPDQDKPVKEGEIAKTDRGLGEKDSHTGTRLTKEALLAMDEATLHLQTKAERLLCKSEMSMLSSGPIVSTCGLGSSFCGSDSSAAANSASQIPASSLIRDRGFHHEKASLNEMRKNLEEPCKDSNGDVLARWRLRRKMEIGESQHLSKTQNYSSLDHTNLPKSSMNHELDARLEDFRKRLLSHRLPITSEDIQYERQRMDILMENGEQEKDSTSIQPEPALLITQPDPVLERLRSITRNSGHSHTIPPSTTKRGNSLESSLKTVDVNVNNSTFPNVHNEAFATHSGQNMNNTAFHENDCAEDMSAVIVDNFGEPVVTDPKQKVFTLSPRDSQTNNQATYSKESSLEVGSTNNSKNQQPCQEHKLSKNQPLRDLSLNQMPAIGVEKAHKNKAKLENRPEEKVYAKRLHDKVAAGQIYHQFLEAEKPSTDDASSIKTDKSNGSSIAYLSKHTRDGSISKGSKEQITETISNSANSKKSHTIGSQKVSSLDKVSLKVRQNKTPKGAREHYEGQGSLSDSSLDIAESEDGSRSISASKISSAKAMKPCNDHMSVVAFEDESKARKEHTRCHGKKSIVHGKASPPLNAAKRDSQTGKHSPGQPVRGAIGQVVTEHLFDSSVVLSSIDSWVSAFHSSPSIKHSPEPYEATHARSYSTPSGDDDSQENNKGSAPEVHQSLAYENMALGDEELDQSDDDFTDDPLLKLLRAQRAKYISRLELIEQHLQDIDSSHTEL